ncbi:MAG: peptidyl-prolyl cis-trans isomerase [Nitrospiria bacterium]
MNVARRLFRLFGFFWFFLLTSGCWQNEHATVARVNDEAITVQELLTAIPQGAEETATDGMERTPQDEIRLRRNLLGQLIERKMLLQEARRLQMSLSENEIQERFKEIRDGKDEETFLQSLTEQNLTREKWEKSTLENLLIEKLLDRINPDQGAVTEEEMRRYYENHEEKWRVGERVKLRQIVVEAEAEAEALRLSITEGSDFSEAAKQHSQLSQIGERGDLGYLGRSEIPIEFDPLFQSRIGTVSQVIKTPFGYHLVKVEDRKPAETLPFEAVKGEIQQVLMEKKRERFFVEWIDKIRRRTEVIINEELLHRFS